MKTIAPQISRYRLGLAFTILGLISSTGTSALWLIYDELPFHLLAVAGTLILAMGLTLFLPLRFIEDEP